MPVGLDRLPLDRHQVLSASPTKAMDKGVGQHQEHCTMLPLHSRILLFWERISCLLRSNLERGKDWLKGCWPSLAPFFCWVLWLKGLEILHRERTSNGY